MDTIDIGGKKFRTKKEMYRTKIDPKKVSFEKGQDVPKRELKLTKKKYIYRFEPTMQTFHNRKDKLKNIYLNIREVLGKQKGKKV